MTLPCISKKNAEFGRKSTREDEAAFLLLFDSQTLTKFAHIISAELQPYDYDINRWSKIKKFPLNLPFIIYKRKVPIEFPIKKFPFNLQFTIKNFC